LRNQKPGPGGRAFSLGGLPELVVMARARYADHVENFDTLTEILRAARPKA
jgi:hypothetical protein